LGVRSIVVLPLIDRDELFGIFEILSSQPNAFTQNDFATFQTLADRIIKNIKLNWKGRATLPSEESVSVLKESKESFVLATPLTQTRSRRWTLAPTTDDIIALALGVLVIASAITLGTLEGWRLGWQKATIGFSTNSIGVDARSTRVSDRTMRQGIDRAQSFGATDECGEASQVPTQREGLTVCQYGRVIFRLPALAPSPSRILRSAHGSPDVKADTVSQ
jgi:GAF domain-containing protein